MDLGVVLQCNPPASRVVELCRQAENYGFSHAWTFDSHLLWEEPYVIYSAILAATRKIVVGPMVTNPATNGRPSTVAELRDSIAVIRGLANGEEVEYKGSHLRFPWSHRSSLDVWVAAYGPRVIQLTGEVADGFILQLADLSIAEWSIAAVRKAAADAGRDPDDVAICVAAPAYITDGSEESRAHAYDQCRWFGGMVGNHVADIVARYGADGANVPTALTDYIKGREGYDYNEHGRAGNTHTSFVPDEIVDRFCVIGTVHEHLAKLDALRALGVNQFAIYLQHDAQDETLRAYGQHVVPAIAERVRATT